MIYCHQAIKKSIHCLDYGTYDISLLFLFQETKSEIKKKGGGVKKPKKDKKGLGRGAGGSRWPRGPKGPRGPPRGGGRGGGGYMPIFISPK